MILSMTKTTFLSIIFLSVTSCHLKDRVIANKNDCFETEFADLQGKEVYKKAISSFMDTLRVVQATSKSLLEERADEGVFFKQDSLECLTLVLQRSKGKNGGFGSARVWRGQLINGRWTWSKSMWFTFSSGYFQKYDDNSFNNISKIARYSVLTSGDTKWNGCALDDYYWFTYMKD
jgi:hypothetical protein